MYSYDKVEIREQLSVEDIYELLHQFGGEPEYTSFGLIASTICHHRPGEGSRKLYYYANSDGSGLFHCFTQCDSFDVFELVQKVFLIQYKQEMDLNDAVRWIANKFGIMGSVVSDDNDVLEDWSILAKYDRIQEKNSKEENNLTLKEFDSNILNYFNYQVRLEPWEKEGIDQTVLRKAKIGYYPGGEQITIPHFDKDDRLIGIRGRTLIKDEAEAYGKYRPLRIGKKLYNHPLGINLYGFNWNKENISVMKKAIIYESEKSVLKQAAFFGWENNISVACCGSNISYYQIKLLLDAGVQEIIVALDKQYKELGTEESQVWIKKLTSIYNKYKNYATITFMFDKGDLLGYKDSPIDQGPEAFMKLFNERVVL